MFKKLVKLLKALSSNTSPSEIANAVAMGILLGFMPKSNILWIFLCVFVLFMRLQRATYLIFMAIGSLFAPLLDPLFDVIGTWILTRQCLYPFYRWLLNIPFIAFTKFNNTIVMGSLFSSLILYAPLYFLFRFLVLLWRKYLADSVRKSKIVTFMKQIPLIGKISSLVAKAGK